MTKTSKSKFQSISPVPRSNLKRFKRSKLRAITLAVVSNSTHKEVPCHPRAILMKPIARVNGLPKSCQTRKTMTSTGLIRLTTITKSSLSTLKRRSSLPSL